MKVKIGMFITAVIIMFLVGCGDSRQEVVVYYLNFKPEAAQIWEKIAQEYMEENDVKVKILTSASGNYEQTLKAEIAKKDMPTLFQINGPVGYETWGKYCLDLSDTDLYSWLVDKDMAVSDNGGVYGIPYVVEGYGIIYNNEIMEKYFKSPNKHTEYTSMSQINNFSKLKEVVEDMTLLKEELHIEGVFASTSFAAGEDWRWQTHLMNLPVYYEFNEKNISDSKKLDFLYGNNFKNIFDLYLNNSVSGRQELATKTVNDSMEEFALGKCAMVQNGNWAWGQISTVKGNVVKEENVKFHPIYTGVDGEEKQGICIGTESYICVNKLASKEQQKASIKFMEWVYNSEKGKQYVTNELGFISPFNTFTKDESPKDPLAVEVLEYMNKDLYSVSWNFTAFPTQQFKTNLGVTLYMYAKEEVEYDEVEKYIKEQWEIEI